MGDIGGAGAGAGIPPVQGRGVLDMGGLRVGQSVSRLCKVVLGLKGGRCGVLVTLEEMKGYLRVDYDEDDALIENMVGAAEKVCMDVARIDDEGEFARVENAKISVMYAAAYLYEHREEADHHALALTLRALLFSSRKEAF